MLPFSVLYSMGLSLLFFSGSFYMVNGLFADDSL